MTRIADTAQNPRTHIVNDDGKGADRIDAQIRRRVRQNVSRRSHPRKHLRRQKNADETNDAAGKKTERVTRVDGLVQLIVIVRPVGLSDDDGTARRHP